MNLAADYITSMLDMMRYLVFPVVAVLFVFQVIRAMVAGQPKLLVDAVIGAAIGILGGAAGAALVAGLLAIVDEFTTFVLGDAQVTAEKAMAQVFSMQGMNTLGWLVVVIVGGLAIVAFLMIMGVMIVRKAMIIATVVFGPLAFAGASTDRTRKWVWRWVEVVIGLALTKLVIAVILTLGFSAIASWQTGTSSDVIVGTCWVLLAAATPLGVMKFVSFAGAEISHARVSGVREAAGNVATPTRRTATKVGAMAAGGFAALGSLNRSSSGGASASGGARSPGEAAGAPARKGPVGAADASVAGTLSPRPRRPQLADRRARRTTPSTSGNSPGGAGSRWRHERLVGDGFRPQQRMRADGSRPAPAEASAGFGATPGAGSSRPSRSVGRTDAQAQPDMDALLARAFESGGRKPVVHPGGTAASMGVPESQVERMFMKSEAAGVLGPRDEQGRRRVLKPPPPAPTTPVLPPGSQN